MAHSRPFGPGLRARIEAFSSGLMIVALLRIDHPSIGATLKFANNTADVVSGGEVYTGFPFDLDLPGDDEGPPKGRLKIQNVDRRIGMAIDALITPPRVTIRLVLEDDLDVVWMQFSHLYFRNTSWNHEAVEGDLDMRDFFAEPFPSRRANTFDFPALFFK